MTAIAEVHLNDRNTCTDHEFAQALQPYYNDQAPVIFRGSVSHVRAISQWTDLHYLMDRIRPFPCDIEFGKYNSNNTPGQSNTVSILFEQYVQYLEAWKEQTKDLRDGETLPLEQLLYMAQNDLPEPLLEDIEIPSVCTDSTLQIGEGRLYNTKIWIGPTGCVSPLHYDPLENFLMQIVGRKKVFLVSKRVAPTFLYTGEEFDQQKNTSAVDVENPDYSAYPDFAQVQEIQTAEIGPGDVLFIPQKWWHQVRSLSYSISVNTWWR
jgi:[protein]-arginine 3-hydroxylase / protease